MSNGDKNKCHRAIQDFVKIVASCPKTKKEWDIAASKKNCEQLTSQALCGTSKEPYVYHCVINGFENETLEVCAPRKIIFGNVLSFFSQQNGWTLMLKTIKTLFILIFFYFYAIYLIFVIWFFKDIAQNTMLPEELSKVTNQPNATVHFPSVASLTIPRRPTNVLSGKIPTKFFFQLYYIISIHVQLITYNI